MILCKSGYFLLRPERDDELSIFSRLYDVSLGASFWPGYYTFTPLVGAPSYSIAGLPFLNLIANQTHEGTPWQLFAANKFVYNLTTKALSPISQITTVIDMPISRGFFVAHGPIIQPGTKDASGRVIRSYTGIYSLEGQILKVLEYSYD